MTIDRRTFLQLAALGGGAVFASRLAGAAAMPYDDFYFVQLSDTHWGFTGPAVNPDSRGTLPKAPPADEHQPDRNRQQRHAYRGLLSAATTAFAELFGQRPHAGQHDVHSEHLRREASRHVLRIVSPPNGMKLPRA